jgi:NAD(P)-dependent dehydrogenase (short-subunit alcohol dehydrogenase family)
VDVAGRSVLVTGGGSGIGRAMSARFAEAGAALTVADLDEDAAHRVAAAIRARGADAVAVACDVRDEAQVFAAVEVATRAHGPVEMMCSNAGVAIGGGHDVIDPEWARAWETNVLAHVYGVRAVLPAMLERGEGYLVHTASAAGLLTQVGDLPYSVTKHAVVALAEWLAITHGDAGILVSCVCPQYVRTGMTTGASSSSSTGNDAAVEQMALVGTVLEPEAVADAVLDAVREERFLVLPHPEVHDYFVRRATDTERWLRGMRRLQAGWRQR